MKSILVLLIAVVFLSSCHRTTCPAYMHGSVTGSGGTREKPQQLFPDNMKKKKHH